MTGHLMADDQVTVGELSRNFKALQDHVDKRLNEILVQISSLKFVSRELYEAHRADDNRRISDLESDMKDAAQDRRSRWEQFVSGFVYPIAVAIVIGLLAFKGLL